MIRENKVGAFTCASTGWDSETCKFFEWERAEDFVEGLQTLLDLIGLGVFSWSYEYQLELLLEHAKIEATLEQYAVALDNTTISDGKVVIDYKINQEIRPMTYAERQASILREKANKR